MQKQSPRSLIVLFKLVRLTFLFLVIYKKPVKSGNDITILSGQCTVHRDYPSIKAYGLPKTSSRIIEERIQET